MPTIDKRFLARLLLAVTLVLGTLFAVHAYQARRIPAALRRQAERAVAANKPDAAIRHLRQYLEFEPDDVDVQVQLADLLRPRPGTHSELHFLYDRILRGDPSRQAIRKEALLLALRTARFSDAAGYAEALLKATPNDAAIHQQLAAAQAGLRQFDAAKASYEAAVKLNPKDALAWQRLAQFLLVDLRKPEQARAVVDRMVAALPNEPSAYLTRVRLTVITEGDKPLPPLKSDPLLADVARALDLSPNNADLLLVKAERLQRHRDIAGARAALAAGVEKYPGDERLVRALAWLEVNRNNKAGAIGVLEDALPHAKDGLDLLVPLADLVLENGDVPRAEEILKKLDRRPGPAMKMQAKYLRARLAMRAGKWSDAINMLTGLRTDAVNLPGLETQANLLLSTCYQKTGEPSQAIDALKLICAKDATHVSAHVALGQLYMNAGRFADAIRVYEIAAQSPFAPSSTFTTLLRMQALQLAHAKAKPEAWAALAKQLEAYSPRYGTASAEPIILRAEFATLAGQWKDAVAILKAESNRQPQSVPLWCKYAEAVGNVDGVAAGLAVLDEAQGFVADGAELRLARAKLYAKDPAKLRPLDLLLVGTDGWPDAEQLQFAQGMIEVYDSVGQKNRELWQRILTRRPNDVETWHAYVRAFPEHAADMPATIKNSPRPIEVNSFDAMKEKITKLAMAGDREALTQRFAQLACDPRWAGEPFRRVVQQALQASGGRQPPELSQPRGADAPRSPNQILLAAVQPFVERQPGGLGWLADQHTRCNSKEIARDLCQRAIHIPQANVEDWLRYYWSQDDKTAQDAASKEADQHLTELNRASLEAAITLAWGNGRLYNLGVVRSNHIATSRDRAYRQAKLSIYQARLDRTAAIQDIEIYLNYKLPAADRAWATRNLAMLLVVRGEAADREKAAKLLTDATLTEAGTSLDDRRNTARTLAGLQRYLDGPARETAITRAIELMEAVAKESNAPRDGFSLCRLYKAAGRTDDAVAKLRGLLQSDPGNIDYLLAGLDVLVEAKQYDPARGFADRLLQLAGNEYRVIAAVARYETLCGHTAVAIALAEGYFRTADPLSGDVPAKTARTAELLDDLARLPKVRPTPASKAFVDAAVAKYESLLPGRAESLIKLCSLLAATNRNDEAFAKLEKLSRGVPARVVATAAVTALRIGGGSEAQFARTRQLLDAAKAEEPASLPVRLGEAEYLTLKGDTAAAEAIYEAILKEQPRNAVALNNLAWLLAAKPEQSARALELIEKAAQEIGLTGDLLDTRSRIRLAAKQPQLALQDAAEALKHDKTALRYFHLGLAKKDAREECAPFFKEAKARGLTGRQVHPADVPLYKQLEKEIK